MQRTKLCSSQIWIIWVPKFCGEVWEGASKGCFGANTRLELSLRGRLTTGDGETRAQVGEALSERMKLLRSFQKCQGSCQTIEPSSGQRNIARYMKSHDMVDARRQWQAGLAATNKGLSYGAGRSQNSYEVLGDDKRYASLVLRVPHSKFPSRFRESSNVAMDRKLRSEKQKHASRTTCLHWAETVIIGVVYREASKRDDPF